MDSFTDCLNQQHSSISTSRRRFVGNSGGDRNTETYSASQQAIDQAQALSQWKRIMLLVIAITVHNIPEGLYCTYYKSTSNIFQNVFLAECEWKHGNPIGKFVFS